MRQKKAATRALAIFHPVDKAPAAPKARSADVTGVVEEEHAKYRIRAGRLGGTCIARAFPKPPSKAQGLIAEAEGETEQAAITALKAMIAARDIRREQARRWDEDAASAVPNEVEYVEALCQTSLSRPQIAMLKAHAVARDGGMTIDQLAKAAGYKSRETAEKVFCKAGDLIADYLGIEVSEEAFPDREGAARILAIKSTRGPESAAIWIMHPELRDAVRSALK